MDLRPITPLNSINAMVKLPGSKSYSHRYLVAAGLANGASLLRNVLAAHDIDMTIGVLRALDVPVTVEKNIIAVYGHGGRLKVKAPLLVGDSGTTARLALALAVLSEDPCPVDGSRRMRERPMADMVKALRDLGCDLDATPNQTLPITVSGKTIKGGRVTLDCSKSSQYLSALLMIAPLLQRGLTITVTGEIVSKPYVDMTMAAMRAFGVKARQHGSIFRVKGGQQYQCGDYTVETDASQASYFWAAAAIAKGTVLVHDIGLDTCQGDIVFVKLLESMGCEIAETAAGIRVSCRGPLTAVNADLGQAPDIVPTLAVTAAYAKGTSVIRNVEHLQYKECNRIEALIANLAALGIKARFEGRDLYIEGGEPHGGLIKTYNDHRMAMSFAVAGLGTTGVVIEEPGCVAKSFPGFWDVFASLTTLT